MTQIVQINNLTVRYGSLVAVNGMSLGIQEGEVFGLVGPNGAGKTTTLKVLVGLLLPDEGSVQVNGFDVVAQRDHVRAQIGYMADFFGVYDYLTVDEYLAFFGGMYGLSGTALEQRISSILDIVNLTQKQHAFVRTLSRGMKQRLYFARVLVHDPPLLILDEPASGMDPRGRAELVETLKQANQRGKTIIISSHILDELQNLCTSVGIMEKGVFVGTRILRADKIGTSLRRVVLLMVPADATRAAAFLEMHPDVTSVKVTHGALLLETKDEDEVVSGLVRQMVQQDIRVLLPRADAPDLRDMFLHMTKGELM